MTEKKNTGEPEETRQFEKVSESTGKSTRKVVKKVKVRKYPAKLGVNWFLILTIIVFLVPAIYFLSLLREASKETGTPIIGERDKHNLENVIAQESLTKLNGTIGQLENVEKCTINLIVDTLRVNLDVTDTMTGEEMQKLNEQVYDLVLEELPLETYFRQHFDYKQYDLEIVSTTDPKANSPVIVMLTMNSLMDEYRNQILSAPVNPEVTQELIDLNKQPEETTPTPIEDPGDDDPGEGLSEENLDDEGIQE